MQKRIVNEKGSITIALLVVIVSIMSGVSLSGVAFRDSFSFRIQLDSTQEYHLLRSEIGRGFLMSSYLDGLNFIPPLTILPIRRINIEYKGFRTQYKTNSKLRYIASKEGMLSRDMFKFESLVTGVRGTGQLEREQSPIKKYVEIHFNPFNNSLAKYEQFYDSYTDINGVPGTVQFNGNDVIRGRVHSNSDIYIRQAGGGYNNGWPMFHDLVTTSGGVRVYPGGGSNYPLESIFLGGLIENYKKIDYKDSANSVRKNGMKPFGSSESDNNIYFITLDGSNFSGYRGVVTTKGVENYPVYDTYPPYGPIGAEIAVNTVTVKDTLWYPVNGMIEDSNSVWVPGELWISGVFRGRQTWASSHNIYLKDNLRLEGTPLGGYPDEGPYGDMTPNSRDFVGIVSEKSVYVQYGYRDPEDGIRKRPNTNSIYIYAAIAALGNEKTNPNENGVFSFQYQYPKGSTPDQFYEGKFYTKIDLHRFHYPTNILNRWPAGLDYPFYNPLWPEPGNVRNNVPAIPNPHNVAEIVFDRGTIHLFGSLAQRRVSAVRRNGGNASESDIWNIENYLYGSKPEFSTGYRKNYYYDSRFKYKVPPDYPRESYGHYNNTSFNYRKDEYEINTMKFKRPPLYY